MDSEKAMAGVTVIGPGAPSTYHVAPRMESSEFGTSQMTPPAMSAAGSERKKRGRPRKYKPDESSSRVFSSVQVSSSAPPAAGKAYGEDVKTGVPRATTSEKKHKSKIGTEKLDDWIECSTGSSFLPHVITVNAGEDISMKIMEFSRQGPRAVCIISGSGRVSNVTLRHPNSSGGILTYEGLFEILSFSGSFTPTEMPDKYGRSGMMTITLSGADGRVVGGLVSGLTVAATPVKIVVASYLVGSSLEVKPKKQQYTVNASVPGGANEDKRISGNVQGPSCSSSADNPTGWAAIQTAEKSRKSAADINISLQG
ncbi:AT-hook motif nuclear-localized protein 1-like isoform X2 [Salvia miltiorrhiza]|nr:AT-hook motif nuclear-localized protein 1-like isoform X2 [Salvia miltiorrhiza]